MAIPAEESAATLPPPRQVFIKTKSSSQALRMGITMPTYTIQRDAPWMRDPGASAATAASVYSEDDDGANPQNLATPTRHNAKSSYQPSYHAHPQQQITDPGPQVRQSRLPIFQHVRSMLHKPPPSVTPGQVRWDEYSGEMSESGKPAQMKPSTRPYEGMFKARRQSPQRRCKQERDMSPVSILHDEEIKPTPPLKVNKCRSRTVSPVSPVSSVYGKPPTPVSLNSRSQAIPTITTTPSAKQIKRKPVSSLGSSQTENRESQRSPSATSDWTEPPDEDEAVEKEPRKSHFSWTTYATSVAPSQRPAGNMTNAKKSVGQQASDSRFSWTTVNTNTTYQTARPESPPPSPPPPIPSQYTARTPTLTPPPAYTTTHGFPVQSVLSRGRPIQRADKDDWYPSDHKERLPTSGLHTPVSASRSLHPAFRPSSPISTTTPTASGEKMLPPPPELMNPMSHLESLRARERDIQLQKHNVEKSIFDLEKMEGAGPMKVSWPAFKDAKKKLEEQRRRLEEVRLEEREVGILITRAMRKEGGETGLWVRRVTG